MGYTRNTTRCIVFTDDEIVFALFLVVLAVWIPDLGVSFDSSSNVLTTGVRPCEKTAFFSALAFTVSALLAQVVLTSRVYAITGKSRIITACFSVITMSQFTIGLYASVVMATQGAQHILPIPLDAYKILRTHHLSRGAFECIQVPDT
ncbi:hypothetical protein BDM02DRAFT_1058107 [Thelephora ganbajun]|uniref:Uncharacterized protein n=1 Tax=Thelephora ganbajun TaxID=370292 RepID=A0ACB6Z3G5_THEGA|nr:hypothetical protein BDM02DRAFT_1058107 [Thelephora ganbajun]